MSTTALYCEINCDETVDAGESTAAGYSYGDDKTTVRISNPAGENGEDQEPGALTWLNSARITADPEEDAVHCVVSVADPRGGFCFTVRRVRSTGHIVIHMPHPDESLPHCRTKWDHPGTLIVVHENGEPVSFADPEPETDPDSED